MNKTITKSFILILFLIITVFSFGQKNNIVEFKISKPMCLFIFVETANGGQHYPNSLKKIIADNIPKTDTIFYKAIKSYKKINLYNHIKVADNPHRRRSSHKWVKDIIKASSVSSVTLNDFKQRTIGLLNNFDHAELFRVLKIIEPYYDKIVWNKSKKKLKRITREISKYEENISKHFKIVKHFYNSEWDEDMPFLVSLYPIPVSYGSRTATPNENALICGYITGNDNSTKETIGIIIHEMCHAIYSKQTSKIQYKLDEYFMSSNSPYTNLAYSYINEGLATAIGNGWIYKKVNKKIDTSDWYAEPTINKYGKALYPLVENYLENGKVIDKGFIEKSIEIFEEIFPNSINEYRQLFNQVTLFSSVNNRSDLRKQSNIFSKYFNSEIFNSGYPIIGKNENQKNKHSNTVYIIENNHTEHFNYLVKSYPSIKKEVNFFKVEKNFIFSKRLIDSNSSVTILSVQDNDNLEKVIKKLSVSKIDRNNPLIILE